MDDKLVGSSQIIFIFPIWKPIDFREKKRKYGLHEEKNCLVITVLQCQPLHPALWGFASTDIDKDFLHIENTWPPAAPQILGSKQLISVDQACSTCMSDSSKTGYHSGIKNVLFFPFCSKAILVLW
ncbi:Cytosolic Carboxypeptidase 3 [Manis pentadactyla]|nr:Cytosolic Carboxypeptidase 3 [Manis pentadactyla]